MNYDSLLQYISVNEQKKKKNRPMFTLSVNKYIGLCFHRIFIDISLLPISPLRFHETLLYSLLDLRHESNIHMVIIAVTSNLNALELLEKRVSIMH